MASNISPFSATFQALLKEAAFTKEMLGTGVTQIRRATYASKGVYFQAFASLSTGLERIGKLCVMLDHFIAQGSFPTFRVMKDDIGHDLAALYRNTRSMVEARAIKLDFLPNLDGAIHQSILQILSEFGQGDRYSNINLLVGSKRQSDPIAKWYSQVDRPLFEQRVSERAKAKIKVNARAVGSILGPHAMIVHTSEMGESIDDLEDGSYRTGMNSAVAPLRQLYVMHIIRYWSEVLVALQYATQSEDIPHFAEIFGLFMNDDAYIRTRKTWEAS